jgi:squamous cell carcinoma antigen recognized by T-cells 3
VQTLASAHGPVVKVVLRPDKGGALVEFSTVKDAGSAALGLEGVEIDGRALRVGDAAELREGKADVVAKGDAAKKDVKGKNAFQPPPIRRPGLGASRGGKRGGLGVKFRRMSGSEGVEDGSKVEANGKQADTKKSNADFRAMVARGKESGKKDGGDGN